MLFEKSCISEVKTENQETSYSNPERNGGGFQSKMERSAHILDILESQS